MKVVITSNFALEDYCEKVHAKCLTQAEAEESARLWNEEYGGEYSSGYAVVKPDDYVPWRGMYDLTGEPYPGDD